MVASRRNSSVAFAVEIPAKGKRRRRNETPEAPRKRPRRNSFTFNSDESGVPVSSRKSRSKSANGINGATEVKEKNSKKTFNGVTPSHHAGNGKSKRIREKSSSPTPSEASEDSILRVSVTPTKRPTQTPPKRKFSGKKNAIVNGTSTPITRTPTNSFQERINAVKKSSKDENGNVKWSQDTEDKHLVTMNGTLSKYKPSGKAPTARELDSIKSQVLGKLCGRLPVPLIGHPSKVAKYVTFQYS